VTIEWVSLSPDYVMQFPTSINNRGDRIAAIISNDDNSESFDLEWILIKKVDTDNFDEAIDLMDLDLALKLGRDCRDGPATCIHMDELNRRVAAANAVLAKDRWRPIPCFYGAMQPQRDEPACDRFTEDVEVEFEDGRLRISDRGRQLINARKPTWVYRDPSPSCNFAAMTAVRSRAFDPQTGILVLGLHFWATVEGCSEPRWDVHPIRLPALRSKVSRDRDGGAP
jgi:hypothetical protein